MAPLAYWPHLSTGPGTATRIADDKPTYRE
jgi:hypothetical protein